MNIDLLDGNELIPDVEWAKGWGVTTRTLYRYEQEPDGLPSCMVGGKKFRPHKQCLEWLSRRIRQPNPSKGARVP